MTDIKAIKTQALRAWRLGRDNTIMLGAEAVLDLIRVIEDKNSAPPPIITTTKDYEECITEVVFICDQHANEKWISYRNALTQSTRDLFFGGHTTALNIKDEVLALKKQTTV